MSTPRLSMQELQDIVGWNDSGISISNYWPGEVQKVSRYWISSLDHATHFQVLCDQLPGVFELRRLKKEHDLAIAFARSWTGVPGSTPPIVNDDILSLIRDYGGTFDDYVDFADVNSGAGTGFVKFFVSAASLKSEELSDLLGEPTKEHLPHNRPYRSTEPTDEDGSSNVLTLRTRKTRHLWTIDSGDLTDSVEWHDALWAVFDYLKPAPRNWRSYMSENDLEVEFFSVWTAESDAAGPVLTTREFERIQSYCAEWNLDTYYPEDS